MSKNVIIIIKTSGLMILNSIMGLKKKLLLKDFLTLKNSQQNLI